MMKPLVEFQCSPTTPKTIPPIKNPPPEKESPEQEPLPLDSEFLAWLEELL